MSAPPPWKAAARKPPRLARAHRRQAGKLMVGWMGRSSRGRSPRFRRAPRSHFAPHGRVLSGCVAGARLLRSLIARFVSRVLRAGDDGKTGRSMLRAMNFIACACISFWLSVRVLDLPLPWRLSGRRPRDCPRDECRACLIAGPGRPDLDPALAACRQGGTGEDHPP